MRKSISSMYFVTTALLLVVSAAIMSLIQLWMAMGYFSREQQETLTEVVNIVCTRLAEEADDLQQLREEGQLRTTLERAMKLVASTSRTILYITDADGVLALTTQENKKSEGQSKLTEQTMVEAASPAGFFESGTLGGLYNDRYYTAGRAFYKNGTTEIGGYVFVSSAVQNLHIFIGDMFSGFVLSAGLMMLASSLLAIVFTNRLTTPLRRISEAAGRFGKGDFSVRVPVSGTSEMAQLAETFNDMAHNLETIDSSRASFMGNIAHELRTPMTSIKGFIDGMLDGTIPPELQQRYLGLVSQEVGRLTRLIQSMLDISKLEAGEHRVNAQSYDIWESLVGVLSSVEQRLESQKIQLEGMNPSRTIVYADPDLIYQVVYNIVDNALKFTPEGGYLRIQVQKMGGEVKVSIRNSGQGIAPDALKFVFDRFYKEDKSRGLNKKGSGLGLHICKVLVTLCGGSIWAQSQEGEWCEFNFTLPCEPSTARKPGQGQKKNS